MPDVAIPTKTIWNLTPPPPMSKQKLTLGSANLWQRPLTFVQPKMSALPDLEALEALAALELPGSDAEPMENERERLQIDLALKSLDHHWSEREDFYAGGNMFVYYCLQQALTIVDEVKDLKPPAKTFRGPDMFVVLDVDGSYRRQKWIVWEEEGNYPDVIFEYLSPSTRHNDLGSKKDLYEQVFGTTEYFCFDYFNPEGEDSLLGWRLSAGKYQPITPNEQGWLWSEKLQLWIGKWQGTYDRDKTTWLRFYTEEDELVLTPAEAAKAEAEAEAEARAAAEAKAEAAEAELARLKALLAQQGLDLDA